MASQIDREGAWRGRFVESGVGTTKKQMPQFVGRLVADQKWVEDKEEMAAFNLTEPAWVDWSSYEQDITAYLGLLTTDKETGAVKEIFFMDALRKALGWDGASFGSLASTDWSKKVVTFWTGWNEWEGNTNLRVEFVDDAEASPNRSLRTIDANGLKDLDSRFAGVLKGGKTVVATAPAKPATKPITGKPITPPGKPAVVAQKPAVATAPAAATPAAATPPAKSAPPSKGPPKVPAKAAPATEDSLGGTAVEMTYTQAWDHVLANKGNATDDACAEKWIDASNAEAPGKDESTMSGVECAAVAAKAIELLKG